MEAAEALRRVHGLLRRFSLAPLRQRQNRKDRSGWTNGNGPAWGGAASSGFVAVGLLATPCRCRKSEFDQVSDCLSAGRYNLAPLPPFIHRRQ